MSNKTFENKREIERFILFTDAVIAIAITLLVIDINVPAIESLKSSSQIWELLGKSKFEVLGFVISFMVISNFWVIHLKIFSKIERYTNTLIKINLIFLLFVTMISFITRFLVDYPGNMVSVSLYSLLIILISIIQIMIVMHVGKYELVTDDELKRLQKIKTSLMITIVVFTLSIIIAQFNGIYAMYFWITLLPIQKGLKKRSNCKSYK